MTINIPALKPTRIYANETDFGTSAASFIWKKIVNNQNWVEKNIPIGLIIYFYASQTLDTGVPVAVPNPEIWTKCDGSLITDSNSPMNGQHAPDLRDKFFKGSDTIGSTGNQTTINLQHSHGGQTGVTDDRQPDYQARSAGGHNTGSPHYHAISSSLSTVEPIIPPYVELQIYMRYK
jgi:hypothetical protein